MLLSSVPTDWLSEGNVIELKDFPTAYGIVSVTVRSEIRTKSAVVIEYRFIPHGPADVPRKMTIRIAPPGVNAKDVVLDPTIGGVIRVSFEALTNLLEAIEIRNVFGSARLITDVRQDLRNYTLTATIYI